LSTNHPTESHFFTQVLRILRLDVSVLWTDIDIYWKVHPLSDMLAAIQADRDRRTRSNGEPAEPADIAIQSNAPPAEQADNGLRRINSGFYYVVAGPRSVKAFEAIVEHARHSELSEQPSFYAVLCGENGELADGLRACENPRVPARTLMLSRRVYPNGAMDISGITATSRCFSPFHPLAVGFHGFHAHNSV
jgi:hypothetical protein